MAPTTRRAVVTHLLDNRTHVQRLIAKPPGRFPHGSHQLLILAAVPMSIRAGPVRIEGEKPARCRR